MLPGYERHRRRNARRERRGYKVCRRKRFALALVVFWRVGRNQGSGWSVNRRAIEFALVSSGDFYHG